MNDAPLDTDPTRPVTPSPAVSLTTTLLAVAALLAGLAVGLLALSASVGVWMGLWDFGRGFELLRTANQYSASIAIACLLAGVVIVVLSWRFRVRNGAVLGSLALIGTVAAALAYYVPQSYAPGDGIPAIHDISTDTSDPPQFVDVLALRGPGTNPVVYGTSAGMTPERQAQLQAEAYPDIQPLLIDAPRHEVFDRALAAVDRLGWELVSQDPEAGRIEATDTTFWFRFKDDVVIIVSDTAEGTLVNARSVSRVGRSDVGKNAARLREFFAVL